MVQKILRLVVTGLLAILISRSARADWLCSGQSNMVLGQIPPEIQAEYPLVLGENLSAACFWFAVDLTNALGVPMRFWNRAESSSSIYAWLGPAATDDPDPIVQRLLARRARRGYLFDRSIAPLAAAGIPIEGVFWWQGESNKNRPLDYAHLLQALIRSWRVLWPEVPFIFVQLPSGGGVSYPGVVLPLPPDVTKSMKGTAPQMRQAYLQTLNTVARTGMVISAGLPGGVHPPAKEDYGKSAARVAVALVYGGTDPYAGPTYSGYDLEPGRIRVHFWPRTAEGMFSLDGPPQGFAIAGPDGHYVWAAAAIDGDTVVVSSPEVPFPVSIRYAYASRPQWANLFNNDGMVAAPFSTDPLPQP